jgi:hypothetical protein
MITKKRLEGLRDLGFRCERNEGGVLHLEFALSGAGDNFLAGLEMLGTLHGGYDGWNSLTIKHGDADASFRNQEELEVWRDGYLAGMQGFGINYPKPDE